MPRDKNQKLDYRYAEEQNRLVDNDLVPNTERYSSVTDFTRTAIRNQAGLLAEIAEGGSTAERLALLLTENRNIDVELQQVTAKARILTNEELTENLSISLSDGAAEDLKDLSDETTLSRSKTARYCIIQELSDVATKTDLLPEWAEERIIQTSMKLEQSLFEIKLDLYDIFRDYFVIYYEDYTSYFIEMDPAPFEAFAEAYTEDFYQTQPYNELREKLGSTAFTEVENAIEAHTEISLEPEGEASGFLEGLLED